MYGLSCFADEGGTEMVAGASAELLWMLGEIENKKDHPANNTSHQQSTQDHRKQAKDVPIEKSAATSNISISRSSFDDNSELLWLFLS